MQAHLVQLWALHRASLRRIAYTWNNMPEVRRALHVDAPAASAAPTPAGLQARAGASARRLQAGAAASLQPSAGQSEQAAGAAGELKLIKSPVERWEPCSDVLSYHVPVQSLSGLHLRLLDAGLRGMVYSGDHDMVIPHTGSRAWVWALGLKQDGPLLPWSMDGQVMHWCAC